MITAGERYISSPKWHTQAQSTVVTQVMTPIVKNVLEGLRFTGDIRETYKYFRKIGE